MTGCHSPLFLSRPLSTRSLEDFRLELILLDQLTSLSSQSSKALLRVGSTVLNMVRTRVRSWTKISSTSFLVIFMCIVSIEMGNRCRSTQSKLPLIKTHVKLAFHSKLFLSSKLLSKNLYLTRNPCIYGDGAGSWVQRLTPLGEAQPADVPFIQLEQESKCPST